MDTPLTVQVEPLSTGMASLAYASVEFPPYPRCLYPVSRTISFANRQSLHVLHDEAKDKPFEIEMSWVCEETEWKHQSVPQAQVRLPHCFRFLICFDLKELALRWSSIILALVD